ncbi:hypothetical protein RQP46_006737 [Phenoliferia psychrophenolica]
MPHDSIKGEFTSIARLVAIEGKEAELKTLLAAVRQHSDSAAEPLTLSYRTLQGAGSEHGVFTVVEVYARAAFPCFRQFELTTLFFRYAEPSGLAHHRTSEPYQTLKNAGLIKEMSVNFFSEFQ